MNTAWKKVIRFQIAGITFVLLLLPQSGISASSPSGPTFNKVTVEISTEGTREVTAKEMIEVLNSQAKWETYKTFDELQQVTKLDVYVPRTLPVGYQLDKVEYLDHTVKATYSDGNYNFFFTQSFNNNISSEEYSSKKCGVGTIQWTNSEYYFDLTGNELGDEEVNLFRQSLFLIPFGAQNHTISTSPVQLVGPLQKFTPQIRTFRIYTGQQFLEFIQEERIKLVEPLQFDDNEIIVGLFGGEKSSSGSSIEAFQAASDDNQINIFFREISPSSGLSTLPVITYPYQFIKMPMPQNAESIQFITVKGEAVANIRFD